MKLPRSPVLLNKNENKSEHMIFILQHIHYEYIAHKAGDNTKNILKRFLEVCFHKLKGTQCPGCQAKWHVSDFDQIAAMKQNDY